MKTHINIKLYTKIIPGSPMPPKNYKKYTNKKSSQTISSANLGHAKYLFIVESPSKCAKIEHFLGEEYCCISSKGHIRTIEGLKSIDTNSTYL